MILWPDLSRRPPAEAEPVASPLEAGPTAPLPPPLDTPERTVAEDTAPAIPAAPVRSAPQRRNAVVGGLLLLTFGVSALAHGAIIAFLAERLKVEGMETATDAVSVEIIFEAPPKPPAEPIPGEETALLESVPDPVTPPAQAETDSEPEAKPQEPLENKALPTVPDSTQEALPASEPEPSRPADAPTAEPVPAAPEFIELPRQTAAVPSPRPAPPIRTAARPPATAAPSVGKAARAAPQAKAAAQPAKPRDAGRKGGASKGEQAAYARRLLGHVQRYKRYPDAARNARASGTARLTITIDRAGQLAGARLRQGSGHAVLDSEALATARRAAPYPKPPEGVGGSTISFSVNLDYRR